MTNFQVNAVEIEEISRRVYADHSDLLDNRPMLTTDQITRRIFTGLYNFPCIWDQTIFPFFANWAIKTRANAWTFEYTLSVNKVIAEQNLRPLEELLELNLAFGSDGDEVSFIDELLTLMLDNDLYETLRDRFDDQDVATGVLPVNDPDQQRAAILNPLLGADED